ncbi:putative HTH-type transcriptional repressor ExuR [Paenibacillus solanacearum]|uniref:HTH-type transcriptional repressor ExuR n=1 Tax=Paenibacillus solanacearum TaxID=2048548 RepID=A0A916JWG4_9BACL|nr:LacI family DNA-binding transcriptional regulator [Paenibacillus solanacearum]CAG7610753.1 putative HTH-type transcriptional repressor ExuR [Paenibacillus solanacearum]
MPRKKKVTLSLLAEQLGLSVYTVSKALRGLPGMSEDTRKEVLQLAHQLGYLTKDQENSLIYEGIPRLSVKQRRFLVITSSNIARSPSIQMLFEGIKERMLEMGHKVELVFMPDSLTASSFPGWMEQEGLPYADGLFITALIRRPLEALLLELKMPKILLNFPPVGAKVDSVIWDVHDATWQSVQYLARNGHRSLLYFGDVNTTRGYKQRWLAFVEAMKQEGLPFCEEDHLIHMPDNRVEWIRAFKRHMEQVKPTALLCATEMSLAWIYYALSETGYRVPEDVSMIRLDHVHNSFIPGITHPVLPMKETGYRAADRMLWRLANAHLPYEHIRLQGPFFEGDTVKKLI